MWRALLTMCSLAVAGFILFCLFVSRGQVPFASRFGPELAPLPPGEPFTFAVFADTHAYMESLRSILSTASARGCKLGVLVGDLVVRDDEHEYRRFSNVVRPLTQRFPLFIARGNHERMSTSEGVSDVFGRYVKNSYYSFEYGGSLFCVLDDSSGTIPATQLEYFDEKLTNFRRESPDAPVFVFLHIPPQMEKLQHRELTARASADLLELAERWRVSMIFAGHYHRYVERQHKTTRIIITGGGGGSLRPGGTSTEVHYVEVSVQGGEVRAQKVGASRASWLWAAGSYSLFVMVPRYRWYCLAFTALLLTVTVSLSRRRRHRAPEI